MRKVGEEEKKKAGGITSYRVVGPLSFHTLKFCKIIDLNTGLNF